MRQRIVVDSIEYNGAWSFLLATIFFVSETMEVRGAPNQSTPGPKN